MNVITKIILFTNLFFIFLNFILNKNNWILNMFLLNNTYIVFLHNLLVSQQQFTFFIFIVLIIMFVIEIITILIFFMDNKKNI